MSVNGQVWELGKCEKCNLTYYEFTIAGHGLQIYRLCGCTDVIQTTSDKVKVLVNIKKQPTPISAEGKKGKKEEKATLGESVSSVSVTLTADMELAKKAGETGTPPKEEATT